MPGYVIHLAVAKEYLKKSKNRNENEERRLLLHSAFRQPA